MARFTKTYLDKNRKDSKFFGWSEIASHTDKATLPEDLDVPMTEMEQVIFKGLEPGQRLHVPGVRYDRAW